MHTLTRVHSAALFTPCLPPHLPLALFMKACPLSAGLSAPSCCGADYLHPEATSFPLFSIFLLCLHPLALSLLQGIPTPLPSSPWHIVLFILHSEYTAHAILSPQSFLEPALNPYEWSCDCQIKNNKINQSSALPFIFTLSPVPLASRAAVSLILSLFHVLPSLSDSLLR